MILDLARLPREGVYLVVDEAARTFHVNYTLSMGSALARVYDLVGGRSTLSLRVLSATSDLITLKLHTEYYRNIYLGMGYTDMVYRGRKPLAYRVRIVVAPDFKNIDVELVTARGEGMIVGRFGTRNEARDFALVYYDSGNPYRLPVYALNSLTRELVSEVGKPGTFVL